MSTLAVIDPAIARLFGRIDAAPQPRSPKFAHVLEAWSSRRTARIYPPLDIPSWTALRVHAPSSFIFLLLADGREWALGSCGTEAEAILGSPGAVLSRLPDPRLAVRLRRLLNTIRSTGEPLLAEFQSRRGLLGFANAEVLALPLSSSGAVVDGVLGAMAVRPHSPLLASMPARPPMDDPARPVLFTLGRPESLGAHIAATAGFRPVAHEERRFEDNEFKIRPLADVRGLPALVLADLHGEEGSSPHDKLCRLLFLVGCLKDNGASRVDVLAPYLCYARKDRRTKPFDPLTIRYVAQMLEAVGADSVGTVDVHNPAAFENAFRIETRHLETTEFFADFVMRTCAGEPVAVVSPDAGGMKRVEALREALEDRLGVPVRKGFMEKQRSMGKVTGALFAGDIEGSSAVILDDLISTGGSMVRTAEECRRRGAARVICLATHGLFAGGAEALFQSAAIDMVVVTDSVEVSPTLKEMAGPRLQVLSLERFLAAAIAGQVRQREH